MKYLLYAEHNYAYSMLRPLQTAIRAQGDDVAWFLAGDEIDKTFLGASEPSLDSVKSIRAWMPDAVIAPGNFIPSFIPGLKVAIFHGFNIAKSTRSDERGHFNIRGCFDLYCTQGPATTHRFRELEQHHGFFKVIETGWPTLDPLFAPAPTTDTAGKPTVLYCSTFTPELSSAPQIFDTIKALSQTPKYQWLVQFHPKMPTAITDQFKTLQNEHLAFVETDDVIPLLRKADVMLCDTSSMIPMFLVQGKPVVTYRNKSRDTTLPIINTTEPEEIAAALDTALTHPPELMRQINAYAQFIHPYTDGQSSFRVLTAINQVLEQQKHSTSVAKPKNIIRNLKERKKLRYWSLF